MPRTSEVVQRLRERLGEEMPEADAAGDPDHRNGDTPPVPLGTLVRAHEGTGPSVISHRNITRVIDVYAGVLPGHDIGSVVRAIERRLEESSAIAPEVQQSDRGQFYDVAGPEFAGKGYSYVLTGEVATMRDTVRRPRLLAALLTLLAGGATPVISAEIVLHANVTGYVGRVLVDIGDVVQPGALSDDTRSLRLEIDMGTEGGLLISGMYASVRLTLAATAAPEH